MVGIGLTVTLQNRLSAHDVWLEPSSYRPGINTQVDMELKIGNHFRGNPLPNIPEWYREFSYSQTTRKNTVLGHMGDEPAGYFWIKQPGTHQVSYVGRRQFVEIDPTTFEQYLQEEGLEKIRAVRKSRNLDGVPAREYYSRCAVSLLQVGERSGTLPRPADCPLQLIPQENPNALKSGDRLELQLLFRNSPLQGGLVIAYHYPSLDRDLRHRTDDNGRVSFVLDQPGAWLIKATELVPIDEPGADWESFWSSLTFELTR